MESQKIENLLNLAKSATAREREQSLELDVGYDQMERTWDLIVKYSGDLSEIRDLGISVVELLGGYAVVTIAENLIERLADVPQIEFIEKPKLLFFEIMQEKIASCITPVQREPLNLSGRGVLVAVIDSGIDYANPVFQTRDGSTRILNLWDQTIEGSPPEGYVIGTEYVREQINEALQQQTRQERLEIVPSEDISGHGTAVTGVLAGNSEEYQGVATESELLVVKLGVSREGGFPRTIELMQALDYVVKKSLEYGKPVAVNLSFGNTYGAHEPYN